jgi:L-fucose isomerase
VQRYPEAKLQETCPVWPHAFVRHAGDPGALVDRYDSNHVHAVYGDQIAALEKYCQLTGIDCEVLQ